MLQVQNGVTYNLRYRSPRYIPVVLSHLSAAVRLYASRRIQSLLYRPFTADEVKVAGAEWLTMCIRMVVKGESVDEPLGIVQLGEHRNADALLAVIDKVWSTAGIAPKTWLNDSTVGCTFDGASVLLKSVSDGLKQKEIISDTDNTVSKPLQTITTVYCASHRVQRVDVSATKEEDVKSMVNRIHNLLRRTARFFSHSTKRWAWFVRIGRRLGFSASGSETGPRILKFARVQKTRFAAWKHAAIRR